MGGSESNGLLITIDQLASSHKSNLHDRSLAARDKAAPHIHIAPHLTPTANHDAINKGATPDSPLARRASQCDLRARTMQQAN